MLSQRPGDRSLPLRFASVGTQVGTPAWTQTLKKRRVPPRILNTLYMLLLYLVLRRPGDGNLPLRFAPVGTQVGTPAWIPDTEEEESALYELDTGNTKHWFVHLRKINHRASDRTHVKMDTAGHLSRISSRASSGIPVGNWPSGSSIVSAGLAGKASGGCSQQQVKQQAREVVVQCLQA